MHFGKKNLKFDYQLNENVLEETTLEKDLGVYVTPDLQPATHVSKVAAKANSMVGWIKRTFSYMDIDMFKALYPSLVRSHMEYAVQAWSPQLKKDILVLEKVQQRATKLVHSIKNDSYEKRRAILGLPTLEDRRFRGDLIQVFKIVHGLENIDRSKFFSFSKGGTNPHDTRAHSLNIARTRHKSKGRQRFFDYRVIDEWNSLPFDIVKKQEISVFKAKIGEHYYERWHPLTSNAP